MQQIRYSKYLLLFSLGIAPLCSCDFSYTALEKRRAVQAEKSQDFDAAVKYYRRIVTRSPESKIGIEAARAAARISEYETRNFLEAVWFYEHIIKYAKDESERRKAQVTISDIFFERILDYRRAIIEFNKLLILRNSNSESVDFKFKLAKSHYYLNDFEEALSEVEGALKLTEQPSKVFELKMFLASIYFNTKRLETALEIYRVLVKEDKARARKENVFMNIVVCLEELEQFDKAIVELEQMRADYSDPEFIDLKIKRLKERKANMPGSRGLRK